MTKQIVKFDEYELRARVFPAVIVTLPAVVTAYTFIPSLRSLGGIAGGAIIESAFLFLLARIARDRGKRIQDRLYTKWGGKPTTAMLRHSDQRLDPFTKDRYKRMLAKSFTESFPTQQEESANPQRADQIYDSAVRALIEKRRGKTYRLVFAENCNFGFVRNVLGLKPIGLCISALGFGVGIVLVWHRAAEIPNPLYIPLLVSMGVAILLLMITEGSARRTAEAYAEALLRTCEPSQRARTTTSAND